MNKPPAFQFYVKDFLSGTSHMSAKEVGVYIRLLCHSWDRDGLPDDDVILARLAGEPIGLPLASFREEYAFVMEKFFTDEDGILRNARLERYREEIRKKRAKLAENARKGGESTKKKWEEASSSGKAKRPSKNEAKRRATAYCILPNTGEEENEKNEGLEDVAKGVMQFMNSCLKEAGAGEATFNLNNARRQLINDRFADIDGDRVAMKKTIQRMVDKWAGTKYAGGLNPDRFFSKGKFNSYYEQRDFPTGREGEEAPALHARLEQITEKFLNHETGDWESEHRNADGTLKPESAKEAAAIKEKLARC